MVKARNRNANYCSKRSIQGKLPASAMKNKHISKLLAAGILTSTLAGSVYGGSITRLFYDDANITGASVDELRASPNFPDFPNYREELDDYTADPNGNDVFGFQGKDNSSDNYGTFTRGYVQIPEDGDYTFYISSDDAGEVWVSPDLDPANAELIGIETACCAPLFDAARLDERSGTLTGLTRGSFHYIEAYQVEGGGGAYMQVGWMKPDGTQEIIPARHLIQFFEDPGDSVSGVPARTGTSAPQFNSFSNNGNLGQLVNVTTTEGLDAIMDLDVIGTMPMTFEWTVNGEEVDNPLSYIMVEKTPLSMDGATVAVTISNSLGSISSSATLTVLPDTVAPTVLSARGSGMPAGIIVTFSESVEEGSATDVSNYSISGQDVTIQGASMLSDNTVLLSVSEYNTDPMTLTVTGVTDLAASPNSVPAGSTVTVVLAQTMLAYWDFNDSEDATVAVDSAAGHVGQINGAFYTPDAGGFTGAPGDTGMDFGVGQSSESVYVQDASFLNASGSSNQMTVSFWLKNVNGDASPVSSSAYWMVAPSVNGTARGNQAHVPWGGNVVYFDTAGCCDAATQRVNANISTFGSVYPDFFMDWHHFAFIKNGDSKQIWIDGEIFIDGSSTAPFPSDFTEMTIGSAQNGGNSVAGIIDDFSVFSVGLTPEEVAELANSGNPADLAMPLSGELSISTQPVSQTLDELLNATFSVGVDSTGDASVITYQWYRDGEAILGATGASYTFGPLGISDDGATFKVMAYNIDGAFSAVESDDVTLSVTTDDLAPMILHTKGSYGLNQVSVEFDEMVETASAETASNYSIEGLTVTGATLDPSGMVVTLDTSAQNPGETYTVVVNGVTDIAAAGNATVDATDTFVAWDSIPGGLLFEAFTNIGGTPVANLTGNAKFPNSPDDVQFLDSFDTPNGYGENYGARVRGWFVPEVTGFYTFFIRSDDASALWFNPDGPEEVSALTGALPIAEETGCCNAFLEPGAAQTSLSYELQAGERYYIEAIVKEAGGGDFLQVAYRLSDDLTAAADLSPISGDELETRFDIDASIEFTMQPEDQLAVIASPGEEITSFDLSEGDGGFTVVNSDPPPTGPWEYDAGLGAWTVAGGATGTPFNSSLVTPEVTVPSAGGVTVSFSHRYNFEGSLWDAGQVQVSINGGDFVAVEASAMIQNGYATGAIIGNGVLKDQNGFNGTSAGYSEGVNINSTGVLGQVAAGDTVQVRFLGAWDEGTVTGAPNWAIESVTFYSLDPMDVDFGTDDGGFTVETEGPVPFPWAYENGVWFADGSVDDCGGPYWSYLIRRGLLVAESGEVEVSFDHRYSFEAGLWDAGQVRISVNGGPFEEVPAEAFTQNGYSDEGTIIGSGILNGLFGFNGETEGYADGAYITSTATLGTFEAGDSIALAFLGGWDDCATGSYPNWEVKSVVSEQLVLGSVPTPSTFMAEAVATQHGAAVPFFYQWQRDDGEGWTDIPGATGASYLIYPEFADLDATFRVVASVPGVSVNSDTAKLVLELDEDPPTISLTEADGVITIEYTGTLEAAMTVDGTFAPVDGATSPYTPAGDAMMMFYRSVK